MVVVKILGGFASQLEKFIFAYQIAKTKNTELVLDLSDYLNGYFRPFVLDYLDLPDCRVIYGVESIDDIQIMNDGIDLLDAFDSKDFPNIYICKERQDYRAFLEKHPEFEINYQWDIFNGVKLDTESKRIKNFCKEISNKYSVAIHVRRGDFVRVGWNNSIDEYKGIIGYILKEHPEAHFYFFSNDIKWVKNQLGRYPRFKYIENEKTVISDIEDFFCMSRCSQRILSSVSGFGKYANILSLHNGSSETAFATESSRRLKGVLNPLDFQNNNEIRILSTDEFNDGIAHYQKIIEPFVERETSNNTISKESQENIIEKKGYILLYDSIQYNSWYINPFQQLASNLTREGYCVLLIVRDLKNSEKRIDCAQDMDGIMLGYDCLYTNEIYPKIDDIIKLWRKYKADKSIRIIANGRLITRRKYILLRKTSKKNVLRDIRFICKTGIVKNNATIVNYGIDEKDWLEGLNLLSDIKRNHDLLKNRNKQIEQITESCLKKLII